MFQPTAAQPEARKSRELIRNARVGVQTLKTGKAAGLGVRLPLGRRIAERMVGSIDLAKGPLRGAVVTLRLPPIA